MDYRTLDLTIISAKGLNKVNLLGKMDVYAIVSINGTEQKQRTPVDKDADSDPTWNFPMKFTVDQSAALNNRLTLVIKIKAEGVFGARDLGQVHVPVKDLLDGRSDEPKPLQFVSYQVRKSSGKPKGELSFSYKFGEKVTGKVNRASDEPVTAYPAAGSSSAYPPTGYPPAGGGYYPPPQAQAGNAYQQQPGYGGYPPPPPPQGYGGYPPQGYGGYPPVQQPPKKSKMGLGLGAGLLGGALGGLLIGDIVSDAANGGGCGGGGCGGGGCGGGGCGGF